MGLDSGALIKTLNKTCLDALQAAAGLCLSRTNPTGNEREELALPHFR
jgi:type VI secretion system protein VasG